MGKKVLSLLLAVIMLVSSASISFSAFADDVKPISSSKELKTALTTDAGDSYAMTKSFYLGSAGIEKDVKLDGSGYSIKCSNAYRDALLYQNEYHYSQFSNIVFEGCVKQDVGIWLGSGRMDFTNATIQNFDITDGRCSAIGMVGSTKLVLNNTAFHNNEDYDILAYDTSQICINEGTVVDRIRIASSFVKLNIGDGWSGSFELTLDYPVAKVIGTVGDNADVSGITITNEGYYVENVNGSLVVKKSNETAIRFDMSQRERLYKGSTGFLYGAAEINVPTIDLLQGLKPDTMVQKAVGGKQHLTGDAVRTSSALLASGVRDMQIYLQDHYLEWPYDAPMKDGEIDLDAYQKTVEEIIYSMICVEADVNDEGAFLGTDGKYYTVDRDIADKYSYVLFNEPDQIWYGWNLEGLERAWKRIYDAVHSIYDNARCVGPNFSGFNAEQYSHFLKYCYENDCLPEIISWHELGDISLTDFVEHYDSVMADVERYYEKGSEPQLMVNEYARHYDIGSAGGLVKWLSMFEDKDMSGCMAYWAMANSLNEMAADQNSPTSTWWVYHWYAQMTGEQCPLTYPEFDKTRLYGVASYDESVNMGYILFGGSEDENMPEIVYADNLSSTDLMNDNGAVNIKIYGVGFSGQHGSNYSPKVVYEGVTSTTDNTLRIKIDNPNEMEAYFAILTKPDDDTVGEEMQNAQMPVMSYEAENATLLGNATAYDKIGWATFATSGRANVGSINNNDSGVEFDVTVKEDGLYNASLFYSLQAPYVNPQTLAPQENGQNRGIGKTLPFGVSVDGVRLDNIYLDSTVVWWYKNHCDIDLYLTAGNHKITFTHINGDESNKGNLQLTAAIDKLDLTRIDDASSRYDFEIDLTEMTAFKTEAGYEVTAIAPIAGYYNIVADSNISLSRQSVDYAVDAKTTSKCSTYDIPISNTVYLSQGANTIGVIGDATELKFEYQGEITDSSSTVITADEITLHGNNPVYKSNDYANSGKVISEIGIGQAPIKNDNAKYNYITFDVEAESEGIYNLAIRYSNDEPAPVMLKANGDTYVHPYNIDLVERYAQIVVNGSEPETVYFRNTMSWDSFKTVDVQVELKQGRNTIKLYNDNSYQFSELVNSTAPEIDTITVSRQSYNSTAVKKLAKETTNKHNYSIKTVSPTCTKAGSKTYTCTDCGYSYKVSLKATGHKSNLGVVTTKATCGKAGKKTYSCTVCKAVLKTETIKATGKHIYDSGKVTKAPTSSTTGVMTYTCKTCGAKKTSSISKLAKASISKLTGKSKGFTVYWKKVSSATGYQIQYSTSSRFTNAKTVTITKNSTVSKSVTKLKASKKYYVRIRTYKTINGKKYYSSWSGYKAVTTKK